ncbi:MAG TPA: histidine phosphatase family protein [Chloroflexi bacterium]|jgi:broad specificity phosphatase PhoE|nr:histidine phosphatase family protein [Chloroflexota bacterium]
MTIIVVARHAQSEHHINGLTGGWTDTGLTDLGRRQAASLAMRLKAELDGIPCRLFTSDLQRAAQTAGFISEALNLEPQVVPSLREYNNGIAAGRTVAEAEQLQLAPAEPFVDWRPYPGAETWREFYQRVAGWMETLPLTDDEVPILVSHGGAIKQIVTWWLGIDIDCSQGAAFDTATASITVLRINSWGERALERLNDTAHLYADDLAGTTPLIKRLANDPFNALFRRPQNDA